MVLLQRAAATCVAVRACVRFRAWVLVPLQVAAQGAPARCVLESWVVVPLQHAAATRK